jgi:integrase
MATKLEKLPTTDRGWQTWIQNQKPPEARRWVSMGGGLTVCLEEAGSKTFQARIRRIGDRNARHFTLGHFPECSVGDARQRLAETRSAAKESRDPALDRRRAREGIEEVSTFGALAEVYLMRSAESRKRPKTVEMEQRAIEALRHALGDRLLTDIQPRDIASVVEREAARLRKKGRTGRTANIMLATAKRIFRDGRGSGIFTLPSPASDLERPASEKARQRVLFDGRVLRDMIAPELNETGRFVVALKAADAPGADHGTRAALLLALLLGARAGEIAALEWSSVRLDDATPVLVIVTGKTKSAARTLPLPTQAVAIFRELRVMADRNAQFVFPARLGAGRAEHVHPESLSRAFSRMCSSLKIEGATLHDCRRSAASGLVEITGDPVLVERVLGHKGKTTLARHYDRSMRLAPMLKALSAWADVIDDAAARAASLALPAPTLALPAPSRERRL